MQFWLFYFLLFATNEICNRPQEKNIGKAWPLSIQEAMNNLLRIYVVPTLLSKHLLSPRTQWEGSDVLGYLKSLRGAMFVHGPWICPGLPVGLRTSMKLFRHHRGNPGTLSLANKGPLFAPVLGRWAFKDMNPLLPFLPITHRERKSPTERGRGCI